MDLVHHIYDVIMCFGYDWLRVVGVIDLPMAQNHRLGQESLQPSHEILVLSRICKVII